MVNTRNKMYVTNAVIKKKLIARGYHSLYLFPHSRFMKDYIFQGYGFDALGWCDDDRVVTLFQFKSNCKPTKKILNDYDEIENKYYARCVWVDKVDYKGVFLYNKNTGLKNPIKLS